MPRRNRPPKRKIAPDSKYNSVLVSQFINKLMQQGKKSTAQRIFYDALDLIEERPLPESLSLLLDPPAQPF